MCATCSLTRIVLWRQSLELNRLFCFCSGHVVDWMFGVLLLELMAMKERAVMSSTVLISRIGVRLGRTVWEIAVGIKRIHAVMTRKLSLRSVSWRHLLVQPANVHNIWTTYTVTSVHRIRTRSSRTSLWPFVKNSATASTARAKTQYWKAAKSSTFTETVKTSARRVASKRTKKITEGASLIIQNPTQKVRPSN